MVVPPASTASEATGTPRGTPAPVDTTAAVRTPKVVRSAGRRRSERPSPPQSASAAERRVSAAVAEQLAEEKDVLAIDTRKADAAGTEAMDADENVAVENVQSGAPEAVVRAPGGKRRAKGNAGKAAGAVAGAKGAKAAPRRKRPLV